jgi:hypothetical protein
MPPWWLKRPAMLSNRAKSEPNQSGAPPNRPAFVLVDATTNHHSGTTK